MDKNIKFIVRLKSSDYKKEQNSLTENDQLVKIKLDKSRIRHYEGRIDGIRMKELGEISLRMVKIPLENGGLEVFAMVFSITHHCVNFTKAGFCSMLRYLLRKSPQVICPVTI